MRPDMKRASIIVAIVVVLFGLAGGLGYFQFVVKPAMIKGFITSAGQPVNSVAATTAREEDWTPRFSAIGSLRATAGVEMAPQVAGVVRAIRFESTQDVKKGAPLVEIGDPSRLEVVAEFLSQDAVRMQPGYAATIEGWGGPPLAARVQRVEPVARTKISALGVEEQRVNVLLDFTPPDSAAGSAPALGDGYQAEVRIVSWTAPSVLEVPMGALFRHGETGGGDGWAVFRIEAGKARLRPVTIGHHDGLMAEVLAGVGEGDRVVLHPGDKIADGVPVESP